MIKLIPNKKAQTNIIMMVAVVIIIIILFGIFYFTNNDIAYGITLIDGEIEQGQDAILHYEIKNGWFSGLKSDVKFKYQILVETEEKIIPIGNMFRGDSVQDYIYLDTSNLDAGSYSVWTILWYKIDGIEHTKALGLPLTIYEP